MTESAKQSVAALREHNINFLAGRGFIVSPALPLPNQRGLANVLRPTREIALRLRALAALFAWVALPERMLATAAVKEAIAREDLKAHLTSPEQEIIDLRREDAHARFDDVVGWRLENMWPLAWVLGFAPEPDVDGGQIPNDVAQELLFDFLDELASPVEEFVASTTLRSIGDVVAFEDMFYCAHNAARSAQLGGHTIPEGFHPVGDGGVVHERRHALSWVLSPGVAWDAVDVST